MTKICTFCNLLRMKFVIYFICKQLSNGGSISGTKVYVSYVVCGGQYKCCKFGLTCVCDRFVYFAKYTIECRRLKMGNVA